MNLQQIGMAGVKSLDVSQMSTDDLVIAKAVTQVIVTQIAENGDECPEALARGLGALEAEYRLRTHASKVDRLKQLELKENSLKTREQRMDDVRKEKEKLQKELGLASKENGASGTPGTRNRARKQ